MSAIKDSTSCAGQALAIRSERASSAVGAPLIISMISSIEARATSRPARICALFRALSNKNRVRLETTSSRNRQKAFSTSRRLICSGRPLFIASILTAKLVCSLVWRYSWFKTTSPAPSRFISMTIRMPLRSDSSRMSEIPSIVFSRTSSPIRSSSCALFTWYGISVTIICSRSRVVVCTSALARIITEPRPVL